MKEKWALFFYRHYHFGSPYYRSRRRQWHPTPVLLPGESHGWIIGVKPISWKYSSRASERKQVPWFSLLRSFLYILFSSKCFLVHDLICSSQQLCEVHSRERISVMLARKTGNPRCKSSSWDTWAELCPSLRWGQWAQWCHWTLLLCLTPNLRPYQPLRWSLIYPGHLSPHPYFVKYKWSRSLAERSFHIVRALKPTFPAMQAHAITAATGAQGWRTSWLGESRHHLFFCVVHHLPAGLPFKPDSKASNRSICLMPVPLSVYSWVLNTHPAPLESCSKRCQGPAISPWYSSSPYVPRASDCKAHLTLCLRNMLALGRGQCRQIAVVGKYLASLGSRVEQDSVQQDWVPSVSSSHVLISVPAVHWKPSLPCLPCLLLYCASWTTSQIDHLP